MTSNQKSEQLEERLIEFAVRIIKLYKQLPNFFAESYYGKQLLRSSGSSALNYGEARGAQSDRDFYHKVSVVLKELRESLVCLKIVARAEFFEQNKLDQLLDEGNQLVSIFVATKRALEKKLETKTK